MVIGSSRQYSAKRQLGRGSPCCAGTAWCSATVPPFGSPWRRSCWTTPPALPRDQAPADAVVLEADGLYLTSSLLTGRNYRGQAPGTQGRLSPRALTGGAGKERVTAVAGVPRLQQAATEARQLARPTTQAAGHRLVRCGGSPLRQPPIVAVVLTGYAGRLLGGRRVHLGGWGGRPGRRPSPPLAVHDPQGLALMTTISFAVAAGGSLPVTRC
ncbi:hypothetical protein QJS66_09660 [Kocuria rhizophila]|nr:hypothetical protein QJS66_09660 [Kocuria rhizophila]